MRRVHAIFVIVALLATPLALLARADCGETACDCMCSLVQKSIPSKDQHPHAKMLCGQATGQKQTCTMNAKRHPPDYGLNTLMAPTAPLSFAVLPPTSSTRYALDQRAQFFPLGFLSEPFQPPRS
ncbi:MAG: hypothetical protein ABR953_07380 [Candidatus Acidiferrales bacterium]|jgi:hypothetical protein